MNAALKKQIKEAFTPAVKRLGFRALRSDYWANDQQELRWELQIRYEEPHGAGVFGITWGVRVPGAAELLHGEQLEGAEHATVAGDLGSLAEESTRWVLLCVADGRPTITSKIFGIRRQTRIELERRIDGWLTAGLMPVLGPLTTVQSLIDLLSSPPNAVAASLISPRLDGQHLITIAALHALSRNKLAAYESLDRWRDALNPKGDGYDILMERYAVLKSNIDTVRP